MTDRLTTSEKIGLSLLVAGQILSIFTWYLGRDLAVTIAGLMPWIRLAFAIVASAALDLVVVTTTMGRRDGRRSRWGWATILSAATFSAAIALDVAGGPSLGAWLHVGYAVNIFLFAQHVAQPRQVTAPTALVSPANLEVAREEVIPQQTRTSQPGFVYVLRAEGDQYKIGRAKDVTARVRGIAAFVPFVVEVAHTFETDDMIQLERSLHFVYDTAGKRINGEWFRLTQQDVSALQAIGSCLNSDAIDDTLDALSLIACPPSDTLDTSSVSDPIAVARTLRQEGRSWREVARRVGMSDATLRRRLAQEDS